MAEGKDNSEVIHPQQPLPFMEVVCKSSGKIRRFSAGTEAGFAVNLINKKLINDGGGGNGSLASHIEAVKEGGEEEEAVSFGPSSFLVDYGSGWKLQTVVESHGDKGGLVGTMSDAERLRPASMRMKKASTGYEDYDDPHAKRGNQSPLSFVYVGKILFAFLLIFVFGAVFTLALENLPRFILYINSSL